MKTKTLLSVVIGSLFTVTLTQAQTKIEETWQKALCEDTQGSGGEGTWLKATYIFGYMDDKSEENKGCYTVGSEKSEKVLFPNPVLKGTNGITWTVKRSYADYFLKLDVNGDGQRLLRGKKNISIESSPVTGGIKWISVNRDNAKPSSIINIELVSTEDKSVTWSYSFYATETGAEPEVVDITGSPFENVESFRIRVGFNNDYTNLYSVSWMPKTTSGTKNPVTEESVKIHDNGTAIIVSVDRQDIIKVSLYSLSGKLMYNKVASGNEIQINKKQFVTGTYILKLLVDGKEVSRKLNF